MASTESKLSLLQRAKNNGILERETRGFKLKFLSQVLPKAKELCSSYLKEAKKSGGEPQMKFLTGIQTALNKITTNSASLDDVTIDNIYRWVRQATSREAMKRISRRPFLPQSQAPASAASSASVVSNTLPTIAGEQTNVNAATLTKTA